MTRCGGGAASVGAAGGGGSSRASLRRQRRQRVSPALVPGPLFIRRLGTRVRSRLTLHARMPVIGWSRLLVPPLERGWEGKGRGRARAPGSRPLQASVIGARARGEHEALARGLSLKGALREGERERGKERKKAGREEGREETPHDALCRGAATAVSAVMRCWMEAAPPQAGLNNAPVLFAP